MSTMTRYEPREAGNAEALRAAPPGAVRPTGQVVVAFTLIEVMIAMTVGLFVTSMAFTSFMIDAKLVHKIEVLGAKSEAIESTVMWAMAKPTSVVQPSPTPPGALYYQLGPQFRQIGVAALTYQGGTQYFQVQVGDWSQNPAVPAIVGTVAVPVMGH